jgi:hypothetical protein
MKERPILFSAPMVRALLEGRKTQTRRLLKPQPPSFAAVVDPYNGDTRAFTAWTADNRMILTGDDGEVVGNQGKDRAHWSSPYGVVGDRLWVREAHAFTTGIDNAPLGSVRFRADEGSEAWAADRLDRQTNRRSPWRPSIHMPRWASRITLEVKDVRVERLNAISEEDAEAEGVTVHVGVVDGDGEVIGLRPAFVPWPLEGHGARQAYASLWDDINGAGSWAASPWVWVVEFRVVTP